MIVFRSVFLSAAALLFLASCEKAGTAVEAVSDKLGGEAALAGASPVGAVAIPGATENFLRAAEALELGGELFLYVDVQRELETVGEEINEWARVLYGLARSEGGDEIPPQIKAIVNEERLGELYESLGIGGIRSLGLSSKRRGEGYHNRAFLHMPAGAKGLFEILGGEAEAFTATALAPADADLITEVDLNLKGFFDVLIKAVRDLGFHEQADAAMSMLEQPLGDGVPITWKQVYDHADTEIGIVGRINPEKEMGPFQPGTPALPAIDLLISLEDMGWLVEAFIGAIPPEQVEKAEGDGFETYTFAGEIPVAEGVVYKPVIFKDALLNRVLIATSPEFLTACTETGGAIAGNADYVEAIRDLPKEGNSFSYVSSRLGKTFSDLYIQTVEDSPDLSGEEGEMMQRILKMQTEGIESGMAQAVAVLPDGIYAASNSTTSHKTALLMGNPVVIGMLAAVALPAYTQVTAKAKEAKGVSDIRQVLLGCLVYATENDGKFPPNLEILSAEGILSEASLLKWTHPRTGLEMDWIYTPGLTNSDPASLPVLRTPRPIDGVYSVGFLDGSVRTVTEEELAELRERLRSLRGE